MSNLPKNERFKIVQKLEKHKDQILSVLYFPKLETIFSAGSDGKICIWEMSSKRNFIPIGHTISSDEKNQDEDDHFNSTNPIYCLSRWNSSSFLVGEGDGKINCYSAISPYQSLKDGNKWNMDSEDKTMGSVHNILKVSDDNFVYCNTSGHIYLASFPISINLVVLDTIKSVYVVRPMINSRIHENYFYINSDEEDGPVKLLSSIKPYQTLKTFDKHTLLVNTLQILPDQKTYQTEKLFVGGDSGILYVYLSHLDSSIPITLLQEIQCWTTLNKKCELFVARVIDQKYVVCGYQQGNFSLIELKENKKKKYEYETVHYEYVHESSIVRDIFVLSKSGIDGSLSLISGGYDNFVYIVKIEGLENLMSDENERNSILSKKDEEERRLFLLEEKDLFLFEVEELEKMMLVNINFLHKSFDCLLRIFLHL